MNEQTKPLTAQEFKTLAEVIVHETNAKLTVVWDAMKALDLKYEELACKAIRARIAQFAANPLTNEDMQKLRVMSDVGHALKNSNPIFLALIQTDDPVFTSAEYEELSRQHCLLIDQEQSIQYITTDGFSVDGSTQIDQLDSDEVVRYLRYKNKMRLKGSETPKPRNKRTPEELAQLIETARKIMDS